MAISIEIKKYNEHGRIRFVSNCPLCRTDVQGIKIDCSNEGNVIDLMKLHLQKVHRMTIFQLANEVKYIIK